MKKFIALLVLLVILVGAGFAEVAVSGQVDAVVMPLQVIAPDEGDALIGAAVGRNAAGTPGPVSRARIGISAANDTKQVGINFKVQFFAPNTIGIDDFAEVWWQPISQLKIEAGKFVNDTLRGKIGDDNWHRYTVAMKDPDHIFSRFKSSWSGQVGFMLGLTPIEPLYIGVSVPGLDQFYTGQDGFSSDRAGTSYTYYEYDADKPENEWEEKTVGNIAHTYEKIQAGLGYTIANIGLVRAQYVGASYTSDPNAIDLKKPSSVWWTNNFNVRRIEAAFAFTGMEGLVVDVGGKIPLAFKTYEYTDNNNIIKVIDGDTTYQAPFQVSLGAGFTADALDIKGRVDAQFAGGAKHSDYEYNIGPNINVHLWPSYNLGFATAGLDVGFEYIGADTDKDGDVIVITSDDTERKGGYKFGIGAWLKKSYGGASIKGGLALSLGEVNEQKLDTVFSIPIIFDYTF